MINNRQKFEHYDATLRERGSALGEVIGPTRAGTVLGVSKEAIRSWMRRKRDGKHMSEKDSPEQKELIEAKRELQKLKRENEDLKKANVILKELASFFSKDHPPTSSEWSLKSLAKKKRK